MGAVKEAALEMISTLPDDVSWDDVMNELYVRLKIEAALRDASEGRVVPHEEIRKRFLR